MEMVYILTGTSDDLTAKALIENSTAENYNGLVRQSCLKNAHPRTSVTEPNSRVVRPMRPHGSRRKSFVARVLCQTGGRSCREGQLLPPGGVTGRMDHVTPAGMPVEWGVPASARRRGVRAAKDSVR